MRKTSKQEDGKEGDTLGGANPSEKTENTEPPTTLKTSSPPESQIRPLSTQMKSPHGRPSSIASNLASARGIPSSQRDRPQPVSPTLTAQQVGGRLSHYEDGRLSPEKHLRSSASRRQSEVNKSRRVKSPPTSSTIESKEVRKSNKEQTSIHDNQRRQAERSSDESFQRFFSTFDTLFSKLSAPLAFAGLPLSLGDDRNESKANTTGKEGSWHHAAAHSDVNKYFSKSTIHALKDEHGSKSPFGPGESFYVVPSTGGTYSYAGILTRGKEDDQQQSPHLLNNVTEESEEGSGSFDHFVDASEVPTPSSPRAMRSRPPGLRRHNSSSLKNSSRSTTGRKTMEELHLENTALRQLLDTQSRRLQMWEASAQSQSQALAQSFRALHEYTPTVQPSTINQDPTGSVANATGGGGDKGPTSETVTAVAAAASLERVRKLEEEVRGTQQEMTACAAENAKFARENEKLKVVIGRYREKWEQLKAGAKLRRENINSAADAKNDVGSDNLEGDV